MRKANNVGLILILVAIVAVVVILVFVLFNRDQFKSNTEDFFNTKLNIGAVNLTKIDSTTAKKPIDFKRNETASSSGLKAIGMSFDSFQATISKLSYEDLQAVSVTKGSDKDLFTLANEAITTLHLTDPKVSAETVNKQTFTTLIDILNVVSTISENTSGEIKTLKQNYVSKFKELLKKA